ncbi:hypothetical protein ACQKL6_13280 [Peribacillus sp. NPDC097197]|uniref:hypothetical protein n=1 Tax=Peribacillus sp. NPDC097197 TaxID=3390615 RepID=UPI003D03350E
MNLFNFEVKEQVFHPNFSNLLKDKDLQDVINQWSFGFIDRDNKFIKEFQTTFNSSFWELYLHACFTNLGYKLDYTHHAPDFLLTTRKGKNKILVEAVATKNPKDSAPEHELKQKINQIFKLGRNLDGVHDEIVQLASERISQSIQSKHEMYQKKYSKLEHVKEKPFILAVGAFEQPFFFLQGIGAIQKVCYGLTNAEYKGGQPHMKYNDHMFKKKTGAPISIGLFNNDKYKEISGILFSSVASIGKVRALSLKKSKDIYFHTSSYNDYDTKGDTKVIVHTKYRESLLDGLSLYLNPFAEHPIDPDDFDNPDITIYRDKNHATLKHGTLFTRMVINQKTQENDIAEL